MLSAVWQSNCFIIAGVPYCGATARISAAAPATCGVAIDVPAIKVRQSGLDESVLGKSFVQFPVKFVSPAKPMNGVLVQMCSIQWRSFAVPVCSADDGSPPGATIPQALEL